ncbi:MAG: MBL fold metallo-hydrolase [Bacteroidales bacterium]
MQSQDPQLIMLGTGNAAVTRCYNTCFALKNGSEHILTDAGGGNGILIQLNKAGIPLNSIHHIFVTHAHTDHILGVIWMIRSVAQAMKKGEYDGVLTVYGHDKAIHVLEWICRNTLPKTITNYLGNGIHLREITDGESFNIGNIAFTGFDIDSKKEKQFGFSALLPNGKRLACLGDEPYNEVNRRYVEHSDWLLCEAFCLYSDREVFKPYEKHHSTALDAGKLAQELGVKNLLLFHTEDKTLNTRKKNYTKEATSAFSGQVYVPDDLEVILL